MFLLALVFPVVLLAGALVMEQVERPLRARAVGDRVAAVLRHAPADEVENLVSAHAASALDRYWRRRTLIARLHRRQP